jgi:phosphonate transport system permease protein
MLAKRVRMALTPQQAEELKRIVERRREAAVMRVYGASRAQVMDYGIVPQILPAFAGITVFRWDINIRESTVLGLVGAGGIGAVLIQRRNCSRWDEISMIMMVIIVVIIVVDFLSSSLRRRIV